MSPRSLKQKGQMNPCLISSSIFSKTEISTKFYVKTDIVQSSTISLSPFFNDSTNDFTKITCMIIKELTELLILYSPGLSTLPFYL